MTVENIKFQFEEGLPVNIVCYNTLQQPLHYHSTSIEIILCLSGSATVYNSTHEEYRNLQAGDIHVADTYDIHSVFSDCNQDKEEEYDNLLVSFYFDLNNPLFKGKGYNLIYCMDRFDASSNKHTNTQQINIVKSLLFALLFKVLNRNSTDISEISTISKRIISILRTHFQYYNYLNWYGDYSEETFMRFERIITYIIKNCSKKILMHDICRNEYISYSHLSKFFKAASSSSFENFLHEIRVYHSEYLLLCKPGMSVSDISYECGFSNPRLFFREFKKIHGTPPPPASH